MFNIVFFNNIILTIISFLSAGLALLVYSSDRKIKLNRGFALMVIAIIFWIIFYHFASLSAYRDLSLPLFRLSGGFVFIFFTIYYFFTIIWFLEKNSWYDLLGKLILIYGWAFGLLTIFTKSIIVGVAVENWGALPIFSSWGWFIFYGYVIVLTLLINTVLIMNYFPSSEDKKLKIKYFLIGLWTFAGFNLIFNVILQIFFGVYKFYQLGNYSVIFLVLFTAYAITKHHLFNAKIIAAETLTIFIWITILIQFFTANTFNEQILDAILFLFVMIFGIFLIRSVKKEVRQREQIENLSRYKSELISIVSHQLKNPLAIIKGYASLVGDETIKEPEKIREAYKKIQSSVDKLVNLLNNLLDLGHIEEGRMRYEMEDIDLKKLISDAMGDFQFPASQKHIVLNLEIPSQDIFIRCDPYKLSQAFRNLIDNAIKYTGDGGQVKINLRLTIDDQKHNSVVVEISDSGKGMSQEIIDTKLFQRFSRSTTEKQVIGSGLGLYISKEIVEGHGGKIWAQSQGEGRGSMFRVSLPVLDNKKS